MQTAPVDRVIFLDNVRTFAVLAVVVLHAACSYAHIIPWWSVQVPAQGPLYDLIIILSDIFVMPTLFFVGGYFARNSLQRRPRAGFIAAKARRLLLPYFLVGLTLVPLMGYIRHLRTAAAPMGYWDFWLAQMASLHLRFEDLSRVDPTAIDPTAYSPWHLWFLPLLMLLALGLALMPAPRATGRAASPRRIIGTMALAAACSGLGASLVLLFVPAFGWAMLSNLLLFQPARLPLYAVTFALGATAHARRWFDGRPMAGPVWAWGLAAVALCLAHLAVSSTLELAPAPLPLIHGLALGLARAAAALGCLGLLLAVTSRRFNRPTPVGRSLAASSYTVYLLHLPVLIVLQHAATDFMISPHAMFASTLAAGFLACWSAAMAGKAIPLPARGAAFVASFLAICLLS